MASLGDLIPNVTTAKRVLLCLAIFVSCLHLSLADAHAQREPSEKDFVEYHPSAQVRVISDIAYAKYGARTLLLDLYLPLKTGQARPGVIVVRGGGWMVNDRKRFAHVASALAEKGIVAACIEYRIADEAAFPGAIQDVKGAVRWMRANSKEYGVNSEFIATLGGSSGAQMALLVGLTGGLSDFEGNGGNSGTSSSVQAVVAMATPTDLLSLNENNKLTVGTFLHATPLENSELWRQASPINHVMRGGPPVLLLHGSDDDSVPVSQSLEFVRRYRDAGSHAQVYVLPDAPHAFWNYRPWFGEAIERAANFFQGLIKEQNSGTLSDVGAASQPTHYTVKLIPDFERHLLLGEETIQFQADASEVQWQKQAGLHITSSQIERGTVKVAQQSVTVHVPLSGRHDVHFKFEAAQGRGIKWFEGNAGLATAFYCETWMVCDNSPSQRATLQLEIVVPFRNPSDGTSEFRAVGPGRPVKDWRGDDGYHFVFAQDNPVQTYLFSLGIAQLDSATKDRLSIYAKRVNTSNEAFAKTADAYAFLRSVASIDPMNLHYTQAFLPGPSMGQEAAGMALMSQDDLNDLLDNDDVQLMAHELAHQWWGVTVGIRSWSDFWLNEGFAEFMSDAYIEKHQGRAAYNQKILELRDRMKKLREEGKDRPLHWEKWKDAHEALGPIPYIKGALFLERLRAELGDEIFWRGIGSYTSDNSLRLVDSGDFERAMEKASGRDLKTLFDEAVYH